MIPADHRIDLALAGAGREIGAVFFESLVFSFWILVGDFLRAAHALDGGEGFLFIDSGLLEQLAGGRVALERTKDEMLDAQVVVAERFSGLVRRVERGTQADADLRLGGCALHAWLTGKRRSNGRLELCDVHAGLLENRHSDAAFLLEQGEQDMVALEFRMSGFRSNALCGMQRFLKFLGDFFESHGVWFLFD